MIKKNKRHILVKQVKNKKGQIKYKYLLCKGLKTGENCKVINKKTFTFLVYEGLVEITNLKEFEND